MGGKNTCRIMLLIINNTIKKLEKKIKKIKSPDPVILLKLSTILLPFLVLFCTGLVMTILQSFGFLLINNREQDLFFAYKKIFTEKWFYDSLLFSLSTAFFSAIFSIIIGTIFAYYIWKLPDIIKSSTIVYKIPLILPHIIAAFIVLLFFSKSGFLSSILYKIGVINSQDKFPSILYSSTGIDIIIAYILKEVSFVILMVLSILNKLDIRLIQTAHMLGQGKIKTFFKIVLPFLLPVLSTTFIILFIYSFGAFDIPYVIGRSYPGMLSIHIFKYYSGKDLSYRPIAMAILVIIFIFSILFVYLYSKLISSIDIHKRKL